MNKPRIGGFSQPAGLPRLKAWPLITVHSLIATGNCPSRVIRVGQNLLLYEMENTKPKTTLWTVSLPYHPRSWETPVRTAGPAGESITTLCILKLKRDPPPAGKEPDFVPNLISLSRWICFRISGFSQPAGLPRQPAWILTTCTTNTYTNILAAERLLTVQPVR